MNELTIIMYHYVRPIIGSKFPGIKGLELDGFKRQLDYLTKNFNVVNTEQVINGVKGAKLPKMLAGLHLMMAIRIIIVCTLNC